MKNKILTLREKTILFVEDDEKILEKTKAIISVMFKKVLIATNGKTALEIYEEEKPDIVFSDIKMPIMDGLELAAKIRQNDQITPIILFTAHGDQKYLLKAANLSIDGYLMKPANLNEIVDVFCRCVKRIPVSQKQIIDFGDGIIYNLSSQELYQAGEKITLGLKEAPLLKLFVQKYPNVVTKEYISSEIWPMDSVSASNIKNVIARLRSKIGAERIVSIAGVGWRLALPE